MTRIEAVVPVDRAEVDPLLAVALRVANLYVDNHDCILTIDSDDLGALLKECERLRGENAQLWAQVQDTTNYDRLRSVVLGILGDAVWRDFERRGLEWVLVRLKNEVERNEGTARE